MGTAAAAASPFLQPGLKTKANSLAIASLSRDHLQPVILEQSSSAVDGYAEGATLNTRFGSFPHSTLLDIGWGSQVRASVVDTGSRGRKRRRDEDRATASQEEREDSQGQKRVAKAVAASSGFIYMLRPTPELWTSSLPHRTQVVYTPDYSYILQRIRARPGTRIIEAGAGSGSFTHASARAVYNESHSKTGKVFSFEFHEPRFHTMQQEIRSHGLEGVVHMTHRDVYQDGFLVHGKSPQATAVFLDLPAPWKALQHLTRRPVQGDVNGADGLGEWVSALDGHESVHICTFSPCIEQVTRTVAELRGLGWTDVDMVEIAHQRFSVMRDGVGVGLGNDRGSNSAPADVEEAVEKLKKDLKRRDLFHQKWQQLEVEGEAGLDSREADVKRCKEWRNKEEKEEPLFLQGRLVHRGEAELKTHTSYLVFAVLPAEWEAEEEAAAQAKWRCGMEKKTIGNLDKESRKQEKRELLEMGKRKRRRRDATANSHDA
ncbi:hypothetical protein CDD81_3812 [Ophiocordyceps australis]|uniref:tRNA (adenine(58)-N(1))-methyltransferase catalytic subunit TRM61 n=1 Tax=Ophiocordyceps australis TaxID=1399860 RepID=A0A2C5XRL2_9HYPO|nr:hypothetical protein CDD81_3812 [Ophiocordyceps australis]